MAEGIAFEALKDASLTILNDHVASLKADLRQDIEEYLEPISSEMASYLLMGQLGNIEHLKAQIGLLTAILMKREENRAAETLQAAILTAAKFGSLVLKGLL